MKNTMKNTMKSLGIALVLMSITSLVFSQGLQMPRVSPAAEVTQTVGITKVTINYSRPSVNDREVWGGLVAYNEGNPFPWRAGANENTTITFSTDVEVEGQHLPAGTYGLHMIPSADEVAVIFSENSTSWGSFSYDKEEDGLRVNVKASPLHEAVEQLEYRFVNPEGQNQVSVALQWEKQQIAFDVTVNVIETTLAAARLAMRGSTGFSPQNQLQIANYCRTNNVNQEEALGWVDQNLRNNENFNGLFVKAGLLTQIGGRDDEVKPLEERMMAIGNERQVNFYAYQLMGAGKTAEAVEIFKTNANKFPGSWNAYDSLAEGYNNLGNTRMAVRNYKLALEKLPEGDDTNRTRITDTLTGLEG